MTGPDVARVQAELYAHGWLRGPIDGDCGPLTCQAFYRAKYWLGYPTAHLDRVCGDLLRSYLDGSKKQTPQMLERTKARMEAKPATPLREVALGLLRGKLGVKESPAGSNECWASRWYGLVGPWCAMAACWAYASAGSKTVTLQTARAFDLAYVPNIVADARAGRFGFTLTAEPKPGDLVCYDWNGDGIADHVGLFEQWASTAHDALVAVEGNTSSDAAGDQSNGGEVARKNRRRAQVEAFVHVAA